MESKTTTYRGYQRSSFIDYANTGNIFFVTICVSPRRPVFVSPDRNDVVVKTIKDLQNEHAWGVYLYCIMPDHLHLVVNPGASGLSQAIRRLKGRLTPWWRQHGDGRPLWQGGYFDHRLRSTESFTDKGRYIMQNPVRAGLVMHEKDWPWTGSLAVYTGS
ncbi:MAG TPA: transposase [Kiritimatiellia bacterium]|nr:transposase [Kiritimatiellia bacterium]HMP35634.1 transposase [Kiritimatiellia bacterium]